jgi:cysteine desulfurase / selenocysteine lyase
MTIYLDYAATSWPKPKSVIDRMAEFLADGAGNPGRGGHEMARRAGDAVWQGRLALARFLNGDPGRLIFTAGATDSLNMVIHGFLEAKDRVLISPMEHNSVLRPLFHWRENQDVTVDCLPADSDGAIELEALEQQLRHSPVKLVCVNHASNVNGVVQPLSEILKLAHQHGARVLVDGAQSVGVLPIDVTAIDFLAFPGHKGLLGPTGIGGLYVGHDIELKPLKQGGTGSLSESEKMPEDWPEAMEAGTLNAVGIVGMHGGLEHIQSCSYETENERKCALIKTTLEGLRALPRLTLYAPVFHRQDSVAVFSFNLESYEASEVAAILDSSFHIAVRAGLHCAPRAHKHLNTGSHGAVRVSLGADSSASELIKFDEALRAIHG